MQVMIRCKVKHDQVERNLELLRAVYQELQSVRPDGLRYATFQLEDKVTFVTFAEMNNGPAALGQLGRSRLTGARWMRGATNPRS